MSDLFEWCGWGLKHLAFALKEVAKNLRARAAELRGNADGNH